MKKITVLSTVLLGSIMLFSTLTGCDKSSADKQESNAGSVEKVIDEKQLSSEEAWLKGIFSQCKSGNGYCLPDDEKVFTKRYLEFYQDQLETFEYPDFSTEEEWISAKKAYSNKWQDIYPLDKEIWPPFGMGNGMMTGDSLENVTISKISDLEYSVLVEYRDGEVFSNKLLLKPLGDTFLIDFIETQPKEKKAIQVKFSDPGIDKILPVFMKNKANTTLYDDASTDSGIISTLADEDIFLLIGLTAVKDKANRTWYKCYYPKEQVQGWTRQVSHWDFNENEKLLPLLQNLTIANLQLGATPNDAKRLLGKPLSEIAETGAMETSGFIDEDDIVTTTTMEYDGIQLTYQDERMIHAEVSKLGQSFGWITIDDKKWNKNSIMKIFKLTDEDIYDNDKGEKVITIAKDILSLSVYIDTNDRVKNITWHYGS